MNISQRYIADEIVNIANYINGKESPFLYNCGIDVPVGYRLARELTQRVYFAMFVSSIIIRKHTHTLRHKLANLNEHGINQAKSIHFFFSKHE